MEWQLFIFRNTFAASLSDCFKYNFMFRPLLFLVLALSWFSCASPPQYPVEPVISYTGELSKDTLKRGIAMDSTFVTFSFTDGDGDLGAKDSIQIFAIDSRDGYVNKYEIPFVPELGASNGIKGKITLKLLSTCCAFDPELGLEPCNDEDPSLPYDKIVYELYIEDRARNRSNVIQIDPIYLECKN